MILVNLGIYLNNEKCFDSISGMCRVVLRKNALKNRTLSLNFTSV